MPIVPGHEVVGTVERIGSGVTLVGAGQRVGVPWLGFSCGRCEYCEEGRENLCTKAEFTGYQRDGGYADYLVADERFVFRVPDVYSDVQAAPLMCAGLTTFNALRNSGARPGDLVAVLGLGGLGHLGVQYAAKMGFRTAAVARGKDKEALAKKLGAVHYIDSEAGDPAAELTKLGGASVVLATVTHGPAMAATVPGLAPHGKLLVLGAAQGMEVSPLVLLMGRRSIEGWYSGTSIDSQDTLAFSVQSGVRSMNEVYPLERAAEGYDRMMSGKARFRVVLTTGN